LSRQYQVNEFAALAGVTAKALRHYDRLGLLKPRRTNSGYRVYSERDLERLQQIVALKFLGLPLKQIKRLLEHEMPPLSHALRAQRAVLEEKRRLLDHAISSIQDVQDAIASGEPAGTAILKRLIEVIEMQSHLETMKQYYGEEAWAKLKKLHRQNRNRRQSGISESWRRLFREAESLLREDPASKKAQDFGARWVRLFERTTGGDASVIAGMQKAWADRSNWPPEMQRLAPEFDQKKVGDFIAKIFASSMKKYYTDEAWARKAALERPDSADAWKKLFREAQALLGEDPAGKKAQSLAKRWLRLWKTTTGGDREIQAGMRKAWKDRKHWPQPLQQHVDELDLPKINRWISKAIRELRKK
jgi:MerR family transcriptional regulator, thiopeptide resistance regulator